jgi:hypothetical protein
MAQTPRNKPSENWVLNIEIYLIIGLPARSRFGEGRCLEFGYCHILTI